MRSQDQVNRELFGNPKIARGYDVAKLQNAEALIFIRFRDWIQGKRVLDVGCGAGRTAFFLLPFCGTYAGIDYSSEMVSICRRRFPDANFAVGDVRDMRWAPNSDFDCVLFSFNGLDCVSHEDRLKGLGEIRRVLAEGGLFVFSSHNRNYRGATARPRVAFCLSPWGLAWRLAGFCAQYSRRRRNQELEFRCGEYAVLSDVGHQWSCLNYYIGKKEQLGQLERAGFEAAAMYDNFGNPLGIDSDDSGAVWIYYVARKVA